MFFLPSCCSGELVPINSYRTDKIEQNCIIACMHNNSIIFPLVASLLLQVDTLQIRMQTSLSDNNDSFSFLHVPWLFIDKSLSPFTELGCYKSYSFICLLEWAIYAKTFHFWFKLLFKKVHSPVFNVGKDKTRWGSRSRKEWLALFFQFHLLSPSDAIPLGPPPKTMKWKKEKLLEDDSIDRLNEMIVFGTK